MTNKFEFSSGHEMSASANDGERLFVKTKQLISSILPCSRGQDLLGCLKSRATEEDIELYWRLAEIKEAADKKAESNRTMLDQTNVFPV